MTVVLVLLCGLLSELSGQNNQSYCLKVPPKGFLKRTQILLLLFRKIDKDLNMHGMLMANFS